MTVSKLAKHTQVDLTFKVPHHPGLLTLPKYKDNMVARRRAEIQGEVKNKVWSTRLPQIR